MKNRLLRCAAIGAFSLAAATAAHAQTAKDAYTEFEQKEMLPFQPNDALGGGPTGPVAFGGGGAGLNVVKAFQGISQYDVASYGRNFIPPDTMGAVGKTQYTEFVNGGFAVFDKATGAQVKASSDVAFWAGAGQIGANGDSRVMYDKAADRWVALSFGASVSDIQIAVSNTSDAAGTWKSTKFTGFAGGTADYPTLALDTNAAYIGTNNFDASNNFAGTSLNVIPLSSLFSAGGPTTAGRGVLNTPYSSSTGGADRGFAIQGVNSSDASTTGQIIAASLFSDDVLTYKINGVNDLSTATVTPIKYVGITDYGDNGAGRQPNAIPDICGTPGGCSFPNNDRVIDTLDQRIGSSAYEVNGRIYSVFTATPVGGDTTYVRYTVVDAATGNLLDEGQIGDGVHDYFEGSLAVNSKGQVVIAYNRSGSGADGAVSFLAQSFRTSASGHIYRVGDEQLLKVSLVDDYHNGSFDGQIANGRQRWGDYSAVSLDPEDSSQFWVIGEYAREYNDAASGHPGGSGGSRWSTWIAQLDVGNSVPEPTTWALMLAGFGMMGAALRRRRASAL